MMEVDGVYDGVSSCALAKKMEWFGLEVVNFYYFRSNFVPCGTHVDLDMVRW